MTRFLFASDSFKGSLSSERIAQILTEEALRALPGAACDAVPIADGGEGTVDAVLAACGGERVTVTVTGPLGAPVLASYGVLPNGACVIEMAAASGITLVPTAELDPLRATTAGTGQLIAHALAHGARELYLGLGGSATNDGGMGCLRALGVRFYDADGAELMGCGANLARVARVDASGLDPAVRAARITVMSDVTNPLTGPRGATAVFGPQKGAGPRELEELEAGMVSYAAALARDCGVDVADAPGAGAAGGMGAAALGVLGAQMSSGIDTLLDLAGFDGLLAGADVCFTGEGRVDAQSADGKVLSGLARRCAAAGVPLVAIVGSQGEGAEVLLERGVSRIVPCVGPDVPIAQAIAHAEENYRRAAALIFDGIAATGEV